VHGTSGVSHGACIRGADAEVQLPQLLAGNVVPKDSGWSTGLTEERQRLMSCSFCKPPLQGSSDPKRWV